MATQQDAGNSGWLTDAWDFVDNGLARANDALKTYVNWDQYQENKETAEVQRSFLDNFASSMQSLPTSTRANGVPGSTNAGVPGGGRSQQSAMIAGLSPAMLAVAGLGIYLIASR